MQYCYSQFKRHWMQYLVIFKKYLNITAQREVLRMLERYFCFSEYFRQWKVKLSVLRINTSVANQISENEANREKWLTTLPTSASEKFLGGLTKQGRTHHVARSGNLVLKRGWVTVAGAVESVRNYDHGKTKQKKETRKETKKKRKTVRKGGNKCKMIGKRSL